MTKPTDYYLVMTTDELNKAATKAARKSKGLHAQAIRSIGTLRRLVWGLSLQVPHGAALRDRLTRDPQFKGSGPNLCQYCQRPKEGYGLNCDECKDKEPQDAGAPQEPRRCQDCGTPVKWNVTRCMNCYHKTRRDVPDPSKARSTTEVQRPWNYKEMSDD